MGGVIAVCGYKPYQIEMEYRRSMATGLKALTPHCFFAPGIRYDSLTVFHSLAVDKGRRIMSAQAPRSAFFMRQVASVIVITRDVRAT